ncbi:MAG: hypothetical protein HQ518_25095 [Rhodopirellula sp.]|nr:hypothetical protein [Rhodopirellula sp.]
MEPSLIPTLAAVGDPQSTDPDGSIKQLYRHKERSGGFLMIESAPRKRYRRVFIFHDENGEVLHKSTMRVRN